MPTTTYRVTVRNDAGRTRTLTATLPAAPTAAGERPARAIDERRRVWWALRDARRVHGTERLVSLRAA